MKFEPVFEVSEHYDGPRYGVASFNGVRHRFRSRYLDATEYSGDFESVDIFELTPVESSSEQETVLATAEFRSVENQPQLEPGQLRYLEVAWQTVSELAQQTAARDRVKKRGA